MEKDKQNNFFCILTAFGSIEQFINQKKYLINEISNSFKIFYIINSEKLEFNSKKRSRDLNKIKNMLPNNCILFDPYNSKEFIDFSKDKRLIVFFNVGRSWRDYRTHYLLKKVKAKLIVIQNIGNSQSTTYPKAKSFFQQSFYKHLPHKILIILSIFNFFPKVDIRFLSNRINFERATNNFFYKISKKNKYIKLFYTKNFFLVNTLAFDTMHSSTLKISEEKIVMVDTNVNHKDNIQFSGLLTDEQVEKIYKKLEIFLKEISVLYSKPVVVCVHPSQNLNEIKKYMPEFEIVKYKTRENIYKAFLVFFYDSSAIVDAYLLKKRLVVLENALMGKSLTILSKTYPFKTGVKKINLQEKLNINDKELFLKNIEEVNKSKKYIDFIENNLQPDGVDNGSKKIINIIKNNLFIK